VSNRREFTLTKDHINLLQEIEFTMLDWEYPGAPGGDAKRPYGNSGHNAIRDMADALGRLDPDHDEIDADDATNEILAIWNETADALQVILHTRSFEPGIYVKTRGHRWKRKS
jgi:hypothetical protein